MGFSIVGGCGSPHGDLPIYVKTVFGKASGRDELKIFSKVQHAVDSDSLSVRWCIQGAAAEDGRLKRGDQIMAVNGQTLEGVTHEEAVGILKRTKGSVTLTVLS